MGTRYLLIEIFRRILELGWVEEVKQEVNESSEDGVYRDCEQPGYCHLTENIPANFIYSFCSAHTEYR
jgi:hypothetical protein